MYAAVIDDFVVDRECVPVVVEKKEKIETLFDVVLSLGDVGQDESKREKQWVGLRGTITNRRNAKEYIVALCHPEDHITMKLPPHLLDTLSLRTVEAQTKAAISVDDEISELTISGTDLAVTLAMSAIEDSVDKFKKGRDKEDEMSRREKRLSSEAAVRLDTRFMRALSQHSDGTSMPEDYENAPDYVKRVMLQCWSEDTPNKDGVSDTTDSPGAEMDHSGITEATSRSQRNHLVHLREQVGGMQLLGSDGFARSNVNHGQHVASDTPSKKVFDLRDFAKQCGYDDADIDLALQNPPVNMTPKEFLSKLYENKSLKRHSPLSGKVDPDGPVVPPKLSSNSGGSSSEIIASKSPSAGDSSKKSTSEILYARGRGRDMPSAFYADYWQRLARDFQEEDETTDINELKQRNAERQKIIKSALIDQRNSASAAVDDSRPIPSPTQTKNKKSGKKKRAKSASQSPKLNGASQRDESPVLVDLTKLDSSVEIVDVADRVLVDLTGDTSLDNGRTPQVSGEFDETCLMEVWPSQTVTGGTAYPQTDRRADSRERCTRDHSSHRSQRRLRHIIIDGSNVAMTRGHEKVTVFVPQWRQRMPTPQYPIRQQQLLERLKDSGHLVFTPARKVDGRNIVCYDDRYVLRLAEQTDGVIVSNDNYRDLMSEQPSWRKLVQDRLLMYSFVGDIFMPPDDPLGRDGPTLDDFLAADSPVSHSNLASQTRPPFSNRGNFRQPSFTSPPPFSQRPPQQQQHHQRPSWQPKRSKPGRSPEETDHLTTLLRSLFPNREQEDKIRKVLQNHRSETDINKLSNYIMNI